MPVSHEDFCVLEEYSRNHERDIMDDMRDNPPFPVSMLVKVYQDYNRKTILGTGRVIENVWSVVMLQHSNLVKMDNGENWRVYSDRLGRHWNNRTQTKFLRGVK